MAKLKKSRSAIKKRQRRQDKAELKQQLRARAAAQARAEQELAMAWQAAHHADGFPSRDAALTHANLVLANNVVRCARCPREDTGAVYIWKCDECDGWHAVVRYDDDPTPVPDNAERIEFSHTTRCRAASKYQSNLKSFAKSGCVSAKLAYKTREHAEAQARIQLAKNNGFGEGHKHLSVYWCRLCGHWHITSSKCHDPVCGYVMPPDGEASREDLRLGRDNDTWLKSIMGMNRTLRQIHDNFVRQSRSDANAGADWAELQPSFAARIELNNLPNKVTRRQAKLKPKRKDRSARQRKDKQHLHELETRLGQLHWSSMTLDELEELDLGVDMEDVY